MFTGLIQGVGKIQAQGKGVVVEIPSSFCSIALGDSISVEGVCLTVADLRDKAFKAVISEETLKRTVLGYRAAEQGFVNLEPALRLSDRLGGHLVSGHVDGLGKVISIERLKNSWNFGISWENNSFSKYTCAKASIALNGVSLTVSKTHKEENLFFIAVVPHTWENTSLKYLKKGDLINLEADLMAKYAESILMKNHQNTKISNDPNKMKSDLSIEWLIKNGFS